MSVLYQPRVAPEEVPEGPHPPKGFRRLSFKRVERRAAMARMTWSEFWRDMGVRLLVIAALFALAGLMMWIFPPR